MTDLLTILVGAGIVMGLAHWGAHAVAWVWGWSEELVRRRRMR